MLVNFIKVAYDDVLVKPRQEANFWILISFLPTFLVSRLMVYLDPGLFINIRGVHIHHLTYGIFLLAIAGFLSQNLSNPKWKIMVATIYGVGLALSFDEFGMWLRLQDDYWVRQSYDAVLIILSFLISLVYFSSLWIRFFNLSRKIKNKVF